MRVSIVILNYNYARFLDQAIDSALGQTYADCEVVVVDNGSTDASLEVAARYGDRIRLVKQAVNIGQGRGYNLGMEAARGEWLIWLDADDVLDNDAMASCLQLVQADTAKVQFPLRRVDANNQPLGGVVPHLRHAGDVRPLIKKFGHYAGPPGSGNLYRRTAVERYFPVPTEDWPICTDTVPFITAPFHGSVVDTGRALGAYRLHGKSAPNAPGYSGNYSTSMGSEVRLNMSARDRSLALLRQHSGIDVGGPFLTLPTHLRNRIISWRMAPQSHPFAQDTARSLWRQMNESLRQCPGYSRLERVAMRSWTLGALLMPAPLARKLMSTTRSAPALDWFLRWSKRRHV